MSENDHVDHWRQNAIRYFYRRMDECSGTVSSYLDGVVRPSTFRVSGNLASVHVVANFSLTDTVRDDPETVEIALDNTWTATGPALHTSSIQHEHSPGYLVITLRNVTTRTASITGTIPLVNGGSITRATTLQITSSHP